MKIVFAGTPEFASTSLRALVEAGASVDLVLCQPDRPAGRGLALNACAVKRLAVSCGLDVFQPQTLRGDTQALERIRAAKADLMVVAAYGLILPQTVLDLPRYGCINIHASLLPRWRGAAPIQRAILAGDTETGICIMRMEAGLDTGPVLMRESLVIGPTESAGQLHDRLAALGARMVVDVVQHVGERIPIPQAGEGITYAAKLEKSEAFLDFRNDAEVLARQVRAFNPVPGASARLEGEPLKVWRAEPGLATVDSSPGEVLLADRGELVVACGRGTLRLLELQKAGGKRLAADRFLVGSRIQAGHRFEVGESVPRIPQPQARSGDRH